jgi:Rab3 GTPase-activating protein catalytic subunit
LKSSIIYFFAKYLCPDAKLLGSTSNETELDLHNKKTKEILKKLNLMKSSSNDNTGLLNKLSVCLCIVTNLAGTRGLAQVWKEFLLELRFRYDNSIIIPDLVGQLKSSKTKSTKSDDPDKLVLPDLSKCLLHQKLQMLNCCIRKKLDRQKIEMSSFKQNIQNQNNNNDEEDEEDEFFDCEDEETMKPDGRFKKFNDLKLLNKPNEFIYVPLTQVKYIY